MNTIKMLRLLLVFLVSISFAQENTIVKLNVKETAGLDRKLEYVEFTCQLEQDIINKNELAFYAQEVNTGFKIPCQANIIRSDSEIKKSIVQIIFPVTCSPFEEKYYLIKTAEKKELNQSDLTLSGEGTELIIENEYYRADLRKNDNVEPQSYMSGQIRELMIKMGLNRLLTNAEDRLHWAPNFKRPELEYYTTIAHWQLPKTNQIYQGLYQISTLREDFAPDHPEILLTARYRFYSGLPYFRFYSRMEMKENVWLELLRNDEMAMDSMFTNMAFERPNGEIVDVEFSDRYELLKKHPIENDSPWLCFYNSDEGFAFGTIRIKYDNTDIYGNDSPTFAPHTQIGEWLKGVKYWNRRLIHDHLTFVPEGSRYIEDNAYLVFKINPNDKLKDIRSWSKQLRFPLIVNVEYPQN